MTMDLSQFSMPERKTAYWHDQIGVCAVIAAHWATNLDNITLIAFEPTDKNSKILLPDRSNVFLLPPDRITDIISIPHAFFVDRDTEEQLSRLIPTQDISNEIFKQVMAPYIGLTDESLVFIDEQKSRTQKPNYSVKDDNPIYAVSAKHKPLIQNAKRNLAEQFQSRRADFEAGKGHIDGLEEILESIFNAQNEVFDAIAEAKRRNLGGPKSEPN